MGVDKTKLQQPFPKSAIRQRQGGGGRMLDYIEGHTVIHRLNEVCDSWDFAIVREWQEGNLLKAHVRLTLPGLGSREHIGVQKVSDNGGEDLHKGAVTDALKKAATLFGVGLELYGPDYESAPQPARKTADETRKDMAHDFPEQSGDLVDAVRAKREQATGGGDMTSESQQKSLHKQGQNKGLTKDGFVVWLADAFNGRTSTKALTKAEGNKAAVLLNQLDKGKVDGYNALAEQNKEATS
jgi:recombination DNA repair RAD52 pathway protein